jgi:hypothetical protein
VAHAEVITRATHGDSLADILERVLDKGIVIVGDIKVKIADVELLSIQIRLLICSVDKAKELGIGWWWQEAGDSQRAVAETPPSPPRPLPEPEPEARTPWEEYQRFHEFQRFQKAMSALENEPERTSSTRASEVSQS